MTKKSGRTLLCGEEDTRGKELIRKERMSREVQWTKKPDGARGGAEEKSTDREEGENR